MGRGPGHTTRSLLLLPGPSQQPAPGEVGPSAWGGGTKHLGPGPSQQPAPGEVGPSTWGLLRLCLPAGLALAEYDQPYGGFLDILRGGTERLFTNLKDTSSKVIQSVAK